jgi:T4 bacteriophage base plate protein
MDQPITTPAANPLLKYFRQPAIYMKLPSDGRFWPDGTLDLPVTGEIPVYPMTAKDEITLRTPDALMNGTSVVEVIQSCCPSIKNAWKMPSIDVDAVLIGVRIASYGHEMAVDTKCPHCNEDNSNSIDLRPVLSSIVPPDFSQKIETHDLKIKLKPQEFFGVNRQNIINFEEQKILEAFSNDAIDRETRAGMISNSMTRLIDIGTDTITDSTEYIELLDGTIVNNRDHLKEFYQNTDGAVLRQIQEVLQKFNEQSVIKPKKAKCTECEKEYDIPLEFDYANFFATGS